MDGESIEYMKDLVCLAREQEVEVLKGSTFREFGHLGRMRDSEATRMIYMS